MANLVSPGVQVSVTDESVYGPAGAGTVPMIFIATGENKVDPTGTYADGIALYTKPEYAGKPVLVTSQRELTQYFGNVDFRKVSGTVQQGDETNEYGLLTAYSFLGQSAAAYIVRGNIDLTALRPQDEEPTGNPEDFTYWVNPNTTTYGIVDSAWVPVTPNVEVVASAGAATTSPVDGEFLVEIVDNGTTTALYYYYGEGSAWVAVDSTTADIAVATNASEATGGDFNILTYPAAGRGLDVDLRLFTEEAGEFVAIAAEPVAGAASVTLQYGGADFDATVSTTEPVGAPNDGAIWFDSDLNELAIFEINASNEWEQVAEADIVYQTSAPNAALYSVGQYWIDTNEATYPVIYRHNGTSWVMKDSADQTTPAGVVFGDITEEYDVAGGVPSALLDEAPDALLYPVGMTAINMCRSSNTVRKYDESLTTTWKWRNFAGNQADGSGSFGRLAQRKVVTSALQASTTGEELREETVAFRLIAAPGYAELYDEMVTLNTDRNETAFVIVDAPFRKTPNEAVTWIQGTNASENGEEGLVGKNTYSAAYYPSVLTTNPATGDSVVAPASHSVLYTYAYNDNVSYQWFAPAGLTRGVVQNASNVGYINAEGEFVAVSLTQGARDAMYENKLNPIARFAADGIVVFGQKTLGTAGTALDRVNVARLTAYLRERFAVIGRPYLFEPNDTNTRKNAKATFDGFMGGIQSLRGVYDFAVVCDGTNNTPARIDANELWIDVAIEPTKAAEFIYIPIRLVNTGELS